MSAAAFVSESVARMQRMHQIGMKEGIFVDTCFESDARGDGCLIQLRFFPKSKFAFTNYLVLGRSAQIEVSGWLLTMVVMINIRMEISFGC